ncbi:hypothetical protein SAMN04489747_2760 [Auraticoccus monumenti]|uniref:ATP synthase I chain n=1 Tax=Auraticoccus monumenti TaxID=675864 RepID=A0A1G7AX60_9ACTN|nr:hypothetical protein SAMN04489747_2760 [Auraticoccus monumenti]
MLADRARRLLVGGMVGAHVLALPVLIGFAVADGARALVSGLFGLALVVFFHAVGQATQIRFAGSDPRTLMRASLLSYALRTALLGLAVVGWVNLPPESQARVNPMALSMVAAAAVVGWMVALVRTYSRLRIPVYDEPDAPARGVYDSASEITPAPGSRA